MVEATVMMTTTEEEGMAMTIIMVEATMITMEEAMPQEVTATTGGLTRTWERDGLTCLSLTAPRWPN